MSNLVREHQSQKTRKCYYYNNRNLTAHLSITYLSIHHTHAHMPNAYDTQTRTHYLRSAHVDIGIFNVFHYYCKNFSINFPFIITNKYKYARSIIYL